MEEQKGDGRISMTTLPPPLPDGPRRSRNFVARHWRGEYPLWVSYWVVGFLLQVALVLVWRGFDAASRIDGGFNPYAIFGIIAGSWLLFLIVFVWQVVGVWRSAGRSIERRRAAGGSAAWAYVARAVMVVAALGFAGRLSNEAVPQIEEGWRIAFLGDPDIPPYFIRMMRDGTELEITGGIKYGLDRDLRAALAASPGVAVVHLDSPGGRIGEARKLYETIRAHGLVTYVFGTCASACTIAFLGGRERLIEAAATLGFHSAAFPGAEPADDIQGELLRQNGIAASFVRRVVATPNSGMWVPTTDELEAAGFVTGLAPLDRFAISGFGADLSTEALRRQVIDHLPMMDALAASDPQALDRIVAAFREGYVAGRTYAEVIADLRGAVRRALVPHLSLAADETVRELGAVLRDQYRMLADRDWHSCYVYASGDGVLASPGTPFGAELTRRERAAFETALWTSDPGHALQPEARAAATGVLDEIVAEIGEEDVAGIADFEEAYCRSAIALFSRALALGNRGLPVLRLLFEQFAADATTESGD
jgi:hypothetical protein